MVPSSKVQSIRRTIVRKVLLPVGTIIGIVLLVIVVDFGILRPRTPPIHGPAPINTLTDVQLGGVPQSVLIRGADRHRTILLFLHGGPGMPVMFLGQAFQRPLEKDFVVVHWDRRGAGKSFDAGQGWTPSVRANLNDLNELAQKLHHEFPGNRLILVGHSWGTYLGMLAARERPDLYDAYVGTGQLSADDDRNAIERAKFFRAEAVRRGDKTMLARLARGEKPGEDDLFKYDAELVGAHSFLPILWLGLTAPEYRLGDVLNVPKGAQRLDKEMRYDVIDGPLDQNVLQLPIPVFFLIGRHDWNTPSTLAAAYLNRLCAPAKGLIWFERSAHFPFLEEPEKFHQEMLKIDRWLAKAHPQKGSGCAKR